MKQIWIKIKTTWMNYLERLAKANEKNFGNQRLDCCDMNRKKK